MFKNQPMFYCLMQGSNKLIISFSKGSEFGNGKHVD